MIRQEHLNQWLGDRQRKYADGLALFNALAKEAMKKKFAAYLATAPEDPHIFDPHFTQLVNCMSKIDKEIKFSPSLYPAAMEEIVVIKTMNDNDRKKTIEEKKENIASLETLVNDLRSRIEDLEDDSENHADELVSLQEQMNEKMSELSTLQNEVSALNTPGVKIITEESLSPSVRKAYARIKEIAPLYASLHNDVANSEIPAEERQPIAEDLCNLDDERRKLWKQIDAWAEGKGELQLEEKRPVLSENNIVRGIEIARQIKRLKNNITNSKAAADRAKLDNKQTVMQNALDRVSKYGAELALLEAEIATTQGEKSAG
jgi:DNA repair exonuclease SbcCD ATPase subunit